MNESTKMAVIDIRDVSFSYDRHRVLRDVSFSVRDGDFLALIGPNGGGKTTLLRLMLGLLKPQKGSVRIFGDAPDTTSHRIGYVPQVVHINKEFPVSVYDVVQMGTLPRKRRWFSGKKDGEPDAIAYLDKMGMADYRDRRIGDLSGGQRQRVFIARALAAEPEILFLDEPTASIDTAGQTALYTLLRELNQSMTIVMASHDLMLLSSYVKSIACVNQAVHYHDEAEVTGDMLDMYECPVELIAHGLPHRVLQDH